MKHRAGYPALCLPVALALMTDFRIATGYHREEIKMTQKIDFGKLHYNVRTGQEEVLVDYHCTNLGVIAKTTSGRYRVLLKTGALRDKKPYDLLRDAKAEIKTQTDYILRIQEVQYPGSVSRWG